jgi:putative phosphoribosyl transferase
MEDAMPFIDRRDAGRRLAARLAGYRSAAPVVLGLPRGGVVVGSEIARALGAPLDVLVVRKVGMPGAEEFALGAVAPGRTLLDLDLAVRLGIPRASLAELVRREVAELERRERAYRGDRPPVPVEGRTVIVVDDGLATGATAQAAIESLRQRRPMRVVFAAPVCSPDGAEALRAVADEVVCLECPPDFRAVGTWYHDFSQTSDAEVVACLRPAEERRISA